MRASNEITAGALVLLCAAVALAVDASSTGPDLSERIRIQEERLPEIERAAAQEGEQVQQWCVRRHAELVQNITRTGAAQISYPLRVNWVEFMKMYRGVPYPEGYFDASNYGFVMGPADFAYLRQALNQEYFVTEMARLLADDEFEEQLALIVNERPDAPLLPWLRIQAAELLNVVRQVRMRLRMEVRQLEDQKQARQDAITDRERGLKEQVRSILEYLRESESRAAEFGVVESVGYCPQDGHFCMIEGVDRVLRPGDMVGDVRVLNIDSEKVEFSTNGTTWTQELGAPAQPYWGQAG